MEHLVSQDRPLPGMADPAPAARFLVQHMLARAGDRPGLHVFVTHDSLVTTTAARLLGEHLGKDDWPWYLEGAFFWRQGGHLVTAYRGRSNKSDVVTLSSLDERDVVEFARREAARTIGPACDGPFLPCRWNVQDAFDRLSRLGIWICGRPPRGIVNSCWPP